MFDDVSETLFLIWNRFGRQELGELIYLGEACALYAKHVISDDIAVLEALENLQRGEGGVAGFASRHSASDHV